MNSVAAPRLRITVTVYPKARGLALGLTITAAPQLIARLTQVTLKNAVDYSSILLPFYSSLASFAPHPALSQRKRDFSAASNLNLASSLTVAVVVPRLDRRGHRARQGDRPAPCRRDRQVRPGHLAPCAGRPSSDRRGCCASFAVSAAGQE